MKRPFSDKQQVAHFSSQMSSCRTTEERREKDGALNTWWHLIAVSYLIFLFGNFVVSWPVNQFLSATARSPPHHPVEWNVEAEVVFQSRGFQRSSLSRFIRLRCSHSHLPFCFAWATLLLLNIQHFPYIRNFRIKNVPKNPPQPDGNKANNEQGMIFKQSFPCIP